MKPLLSVQLLSESCHQVHEHPSRPVLSRTRIWLAGLLITLQFAFISLPVSAAVFPGSAGIPAPPTSQSTYEEWLDRKSVV